MQQCNKQAIIIRPSVPTYLDVLMLFTVFYVFFLSFAKSSGRYFVKRRSWGGVGAHAENSIGPVTPIENQCFVSSQPHPLSSPIWFQMFLDFHISYRLYDYRISFSHFYYTDCPVTPRSIEPQCFVSSQPHHLSSPIWFFLDFHISFLLYVCLQLVFYKFLHCRPCYLIWFSPKLFFCYHPSPTISFCFFCILAFPFCSTWCIVKNKAIGLYKNLVLPETIHISW